MPGFVRGLALAGLAGCGVGPFENDPPRLVSANGVEHHRMFGFPQLDPAFEAIPGEDFALTLEIDDPEGMDVRVWWPWAPGGFEFDPDATSGVWHVPAEPEPFYGVRVLLEDTHPRDPQVAEFFIPLWFWLDGDTGGPR